LAFGGRRKGKDYMKIVLIALVASFIGILAEFLPRPLRSGLFTLAVFWVMMLAMKLV